MIKFIKIVIDRKNQSFRNIQYIPQIIALSGKFARYLHDDYFFENQKSLVEEIINLIEKTTPFFWAVLDKKTNRFAGFVFLENWVGAKNNFHSAEVTTCFSPEFWGKHTKICAKRFVKYCFKKYKLKKLKAYIFPQNFRVKPLLKFAGFKREAVLRGETLKNGELQDVEVFAVVSEVERVNR